MPYSDPDQKRAYQLIWMWRRRLTWILENGPCACGSTKDLSVVHRDPKEISIRVTSIWGRSEAKQKEELAKCVVLCKDCLLSKRRAERNAPIPCGSDRSYGRGCKCDLCRAAHAAANQRQRTGRRRTQAVAVDKWSDMATARHWNVPQEMVSREPVEEIVMRIDRRSHERTGP